MSRVVLGVVTAGSTVALASSLVAAVNRITTPALGVAPLVIAETVHVCVPARDEEDRLPSLIGDLRRQIGVENLHVTIYDDRSTDHTFDLAERAVDGDRRFEVVRGVDDPEPGWLGKSAACDAAVHHGTAPDADVLVFLDADVRLTPNALSAAVTELRRGGAALLTPWPVQLAESWPERLVQPLLSWSWCSTMPTKISNAVTAGSTAVACGQFLVFDAECYRRIDGHRAVAATVTEDLALARALRGIGLRTTVAMAGEHARCRMYTNAAALREGYGKWLWSAFGSPAGSVAVLAGATAVWTVPALAAAVARGRIRWIGVLGYMAGVASRLLARSTETRRPPTVRDLLDAAAHPVSVVAAVVLTASSTYDRRRGRTTWKGRRLS
ncbi:glycosyltransferase involved in cell wall biosynthesis [Rhodococcus sp. 27YEA15]|uniref:glycosyltransferase n=1 Tax=Rhodococcus sp. 27YEA15 TaxID=3156259 RepID=UPI003C7C6D7E